MNDHLTLDLIPMAARLARRGRPVAHVALEAVVAAGTWTRIEEGSNVNLPSLIRVVAYLGIPLILDRESAKHPWAKVEEQSPNGGIAVQEPAGGGGTGG